MYIYVLSNACCITCPFDPQREEANDKVTGDPLDVKMLRLRSSTTHDLQKVKLMTHAKNFIYLDVTLVWNLVGNNVVRRKSPLYSTTYRLNQQESRLHSTKGHSRLVNTPFRVQNIPTSNLAP